MSEDYDSLMQELVVPLLTRMVGDRSANTRIVLGHLCEVVITARLSSRGAENVVAADHELVTFLVLLQGDDTEEVVNLAHRVSAIC